MPIKTRQALCPAAQYPLKCPYAMTPTRVVIHNTDNDASAANEVAYMVGNNKNDSFHWAVDDVEAVQGILESRNSWNAGDGNGKGNREGIAIEICYSKSGGPRFDKAEENAAELAADILKRYGWGIDRLTKHQDYNGKYCPRRTLDKGWARFVAMVQVHLTPAVSTPLTLDTRSKDMAAGERYTVLAKCKDKPTVTVTGRDLIRASEPRLDAKGRGWLIDVEGLPPEPITRHGHIKVTADGVTQQCNFNIV